MKVTIELLEEAKYRVLLSKLNKAQEKEGKPTFTLEEFISMLLATPEVIMTLDLLSTMIDTNKKDN